MRNSIQAFERQSNTTPSSDRADILASGSLLVKSNNLRRWLLQDYESIRAQISVAAAGLVYTALIGLAVFLTPKDVRFDFLFLLGCLVVGWAGGVRGALVVAFTSSCIL